MTPDPTLIEQVAAMLAEWGENGCEEVPQDLAARILTLQGSAALPSEAITDEMIEAGCVAYFRFRHTIESDVLFRDLATEEQEDFVRRVYTAMRATTPTAPIESLGALSGSHASTEPCGLGPPGFDPARGDFVCVPREAPEAMWDGLPRAIMMWLDFERPTPENLFSHLRHLGYDVPAWMAEEGELKGRKHVPSKGTRCVLIYRAMIENWLAGPEDIAHD